jgi:hypothetical protein
MEKGKECDERIKKVDYRCIHKVPEKTETEKLEESLQKQSKK